MVVARTSLLHLILASSLLPPCPSSSLHRRPRQLGWVGAVRALRRGPGVVCCAVDLLSARYTFQPRHRSERELISSRGSLLHFPSDAAVVESENYSVTSFSSVASEVTVRGRGNERSWGCL